MGQISHMGFISLDVLIFHVEMMIFKDVKFIRETMTVIGYCQIRHFRVSYRHRFCFYRFYDDTDAWLFIHFSCHSTLYLALYIRRAICVKAVK